MRGELSLNGEWAGVFFDERYLDSKFPVRATFRVVEGKIDGVMLDERTTWTQSIPEAIRGITANSPQAAAWAEFASKYPEAIWTLTLPAKSLLKGTLSGSSFKFTKEYEGLQESFWSEPNPQYVDSKPLEPVEYVGRISADGTEIWGTWTIPGPPFLGFIRRFFASGTFRLKRVAGSTGP